RLLARQIAADVDAAHHHARRLLDDDPGIARVRDLLKHVFGEARRERRRLGIDHRTRAGDRHGLLYRGELEPRIDFRVEPGLNDDVASDDLLEPGELERY